ncbi:ferritin-like domain-containing protein [Rhodoferax saidenbachensis]|uniref:Uncharacterized ferritin-like protein (DUF455 family) n=1 Tax=Rhodoferax saidenbachensis TaxID=1484693 RepID=A0ABU1ZQJ9_9BURK|nr:ferritin-like domain-containing protein [Rhodoferax saidenbachensis]MDR7307814.1 uncharacterized ferritin-like protein (DUF455 family) [Rhodoferax saidenbachensis]
MELRHRALHVFCLTDALEKADATQALRVDAPTLPLDTAVVLPWPEQPGRPPQPIQVHPKDVPRRTPFTAEGHAALMHSIAHIEFNAVNLALDAIWRFPDMPAAYYLDWLRVAQEEAQHFKLLQAHLRACGYDYGSFPAHDGLWTVCDNTRHDVVARMALVPRTMEARGLDAIPLIQAKLRKVGTPDALQAMAILDVILEEEVGHVAIGNQWYHWLCKKNALEPGAFYAQAAIKHAAPRPKPPFNLEARKRAGFSDAEMQAMTAAA